MTFYVIVVVGLNDETSYIWYGLMTIDFLGYKGINAIIKYTLIQW